MKKKKIPTHLSKQPHLIGTSHLYLKRDAELLLLRRFNTGYEDGNYSMIAGHVEPGETCTRTMVREAQEEAGIIIPSLDLSVVHMMHRKAEDGSERIDAFLQAKSWNGTPTNKEPRKCDHIGWFDLNLLPENIIPYIRFAIENIEQGVPYSEFGW